ncbi:MAG: hypothetical protein K2I61_00105, partial [Muribaculaceae bacterium]|nr:hypothetical protein [Muribaculaceae bacterium]
MKKLFLSLCVAFSALFAANHTTAQVKDMLGIANHLGVNLNVGTTGIGVEAATPITPFVQARLGISIMPGFNFNVDSEVDIETNDPTGMYGSYISRDITLNGSLKRVQGSLIF